MPRYRVIISTDRTGGHTEFSAGNDREAVEYAKRYARGARVISLTQGLINGPRRQVAISVLNRRYVVIPVSAGFKVWDTGPGSFDKCYPERAEAENVARHLNAGLVTGTRTT